MKNAKHLLIALLTLGVGAFAAAGCSAHLGRRVWSPHVFAWRNFLRRPPKIEYQPDVPLLITNPQILFVHVYRLSNRRRAAL